MEPRRQLVEKLAALRSLNPDTARMLRGELLALAAQAGPGGFDEAAAFAARLADEYEASPWKRAESAALHDYFARLERAAARRNLAPGGEPADVPGAAAGSSVSLVPSRFFSGLDWCRLHASAEIPDRILAAVDAAQNRNRWVESVLETVFLVLQELDRSRAVEWQLAFLEERRGRLDADAVRDLLAAWERLGDLPPPAVQWLLDWSADEMLGRQWPAVVALADRLLRRMALKGWQGAGDGGRHAGLAHLRKLVAGGRLDDETLENWLDAGLREIEERVQYFLALGGGEEADGAPRDEWRRTALCHEARALGLHFVPVLLLADILLRVPGGANRFALAFFSLGRSGMAQWRRRLDALAEKAVRRMFLAGLKEGERPGDTIRKLGAGDPALCERLLGMLDLATGQFDSLAQRDKAVRRLATHYLNLREHRLLAAEIQRRYRRLMRVLHPDSLGRLLAPEQVEELGGAGVHAEMMAVATAARRFIERRRDMGQQVEEWVAADLEFAREIRRRRHQRLRGLAFR